jgi:hypothetical protein
MNIRTVKIERRLQRRNIAIPFFCLNLLFIINRKPTKTITNGKKTVFLLFFALKCVKMTHWILLRIEWQLPCITFCTTIHNVSASR